MICELLESRKNVLNQTYCPLRCTTPHPVLIHLSGSLLCSSPASNRQTVINDVTAKFENQSVEELAEQKIKIQDMLNSGEASVDSEYWEAVLKELHVFQVSVFMSLTEGVSCLMCLLQAGLSDLGVDLCCEVMAHASRAWARGYNAVFTIRCRSDFAHGGLHVGN